MSKEIHLKSDNGVVVYLRLWKRERLRGRLLSSRSLPLLIIGYFIILQEAKLSPCKISNETSGFV
jgi:hypothetical protein